MRRGMGKGQGKGYKNIMGKDPMVHSQSARGRKQPQKLFYQMGNIGRAKYTVSKFDGISRYSDGSKFFDIAIFKNKRDLARYKMDLFTKGYREIPSIYDIKDSDGDGVPDSKDCQPNNPHRQEIKKSDVDEARQVAQAEADKIFNEMVGRGTQYNVIDNQSGKKYPLLGLCGFATLHFKSVKEKNMLIKAGINVRKSYYGGYAISANELFIKTPESAIEANPDARAYYQQSIDIKEKALKGFLKSMQEKGYLKEAYVETRLD